MPVINKAQEQKLVRMWSNEPPHSVRHVAASHGKWDLSSPTRDALVPSAAEAQNLNCWTNRNRFHKLGDAAKNKTNKNTSVLPQQGAQV